MQPKQHFLWGRSFNATLIHFSSINGPAISGILAPFMESRKLLPPARVCDYRGKRGVPLESDYPVKTNGACRDRNDKNIWPEILLFSPSTGERPNIFCSNFRLRAKQEHRKVGVKRGGGGGQSPLLSLQNSDILRRILLNSSYFLPPA